MRCVGAACRVLQGGRGRGLGLAQGAGAGPRAGGGAGARRLTRGDMVPPIKGKFQYDPAAVTNLDAFVAKDGSSWFNELGDTWPGLCCSLEVEEVLYHGRSKFQEVLVFQSKSWGRVLCLDGVIQVTERDESSYQEMITHLPMFGHKAPKKVCVIGGGDGGVLREVAKHDSVESIVICELDADVIKMCKEHMPKLAVGYEDPRVTVHVGDGAVYMNEHEGEFDVIIVDSSDPIGPAEVLFERPFYEAIHRALAPGGIAATQAESLWLNMDLVCDLHVTAAKIGFNFQFAWTQIPTYPAGHIGVLTLEKAERGSRDLSIPLREPGADLEAKLEYYTPRLHRAAYSLPAFAEREIAAALKAAGV